MAGREELYLKHIDENTGRIAKALEYMVEREKEIKAEQDKEKEARVLYSFAEYIRDYAITGNDLEFASKVKFAVGAFIGRSNGDSLKPTYKSDYSQIISNKEEPNDKSGWDPLWNGR